MLAPDRTRNATFRACRTSGILVRGGRYGGSMIELSRDEARRIAVRAQYLDADRPGDVVETAEQLGYVKIDPTATIAPAEHTILWSRIGRGYEPVQLSKAVERDRLLFEYDGTYRPTSWLPVMRPRMREAPLRASTTEWLAANDRFVKEVLARLKAEGPLFASDIPDTAEVARKSDGWYGPNQVNILLEVLAYRGEIAVVGREGRRKKWDLADRVWPAVDELPIEEADREIERRRLRAAGIAKQKSPWTRVGLAGEEARVEGSTWKWRVDPDALRFLESGEDPGGRVAFLNPYDPMLVDRPRLTELFDFTYVLEQFKKKHERVYGFFAHPILMDDRFIGMLEAEVDRDENALKVRAVHELVPFDPEEHEIVRGEIEELANWLGVRVDAD